MSDALTMRSAVSRVARVLGLTMNGQVPTGRDAEDLRDHVQSAIDQIPKYRNGPWCDVLLNSAAAYTAKDGERIAPQGFNAAITLPTSFLRCDGRTDLQNDLSRIHVVGDGFYIWSASLGAWNKADALDLADPFPFGADDMPGIVALAAILAAPEYGAEINPATVQQATAGRASMRSRFYRDVRRPSDCPDYD